MVLKASKARLYGANRTETIDNKITMIVMPINIRLKINNLE